MKLVLKSIVLLCFCFGIAPFSVLAQESPVVTPIMIQELILQDADIIDALNTVSQKTGLNIIVGPDVAGSVSVFLKDVSAEEALRIIAESNGLAFIYEGSIYRVMTPENYEDYYGHPFGKKKVSRLIHLHFANPENVAGLLRAVKSPQGDIIVNAESSSLFLMDEAEKVYAMEQIVNDLDVQISTVILDLKFIRVGQALETIQPMLTTSLGRVEANAQKNQLIVTDALSNIDRIQKTVQALEVRARKVMLDVQLVHVVLNDENLEGVDWEGIVADFQYMRLKDADDILIRNTKDPFLSLGTLTQQDLPMLIEALDTVGVVKEYTKTTIELSSEEQARLVVALDEPHVVIRKLENASHVVSENAQVSFVINPVVSPDGSVRTLIVPYVKDQQDETARVVLHVDPGEALVLGSIIATEKVLTVRSIPLVGRLPLVGFAFRYHGQSIRREEFVVLLTPRIQSQGPAVKEGEVLKLESVE